MYTNAVSRPLAVVTGASSGIGFHLACECARNGFDLLIAADRPLDGALIELDAMGAAVDSVQADLATLEGVDQLCDAIGGRQVHALVANAGHGLAKGFLDQDFQQARHVVDTNITGTLYLIHKVGNDMRRRRKGRILITGAVAGFQPHTSLAVYNSTKTFIDTFSWALRSELEHTGITVTCLMPGLTDTDFFERAGLALTNGADEEKMDPAEVARIGFNAMMQGRGNVWAGFRNKVKIAPDDDETIPDLVAELRREELALGVAAR